MTYKIVIHHKAKSKLQSLSSIDRIRITEKIVLLGNNPNRNNLDVKPLIGKSAHRLRVGKWRIIFQKNEEIRVIAIEKIMPRGDVYK